jgi:Pyridoxamine 5'-phosphate oxidase
MKTKNLDIYGSGAVPWRRAREALAGSRGSGATFFLGTVRPDGTPHAAGLGAVWVDDTLWFVTGLQTRKARNLAANPACTISCRLPGIDVVLEGRAERVTDPDTLERLAGVYREGGWPATVEADAFTAPYSPPSAGPPPWHLYRCTLQTAIGVATAAPHGASRWRFES